MEPFRNIGVKFDTRKTIFFSEAVDFSSHYTFVFFLAIKPSILKRNAITNGKKQLFTCIVVL